MTRMDQTGTAAGFSQKDSLNTGNCKRNRNKGGSSSENLRRNFMSLLELQKHLGEGEVAQPWMLSNLDTSEKLARNRLTYVEIKAIIEQKLAHQKRGFLTEREIQETVNDIQDEKLEEDLDSEMIAREIKRLNEKMLKWNSAPVGNMTPEKEDSRVRVVFSQLNNISTKEVRELKLQALKYIEKSLTLR